ncbi:hypothetical protein [Paenibacillus polymyxa]|uniref:hypothetical protein n=1 Tax=Paenibacillus polymyxa TaxID=1406 RepID=UPI0008C0F586|nr:hypothetical protein [Paenibacillus polymyxa]SEI76247.1 hypothetical protein SAMN04488600_101611 [Paenibacillus polymyxa]
MTDKQRNWQEDMKMCHKATPGPWVIVTDDFGEDDVCYVPTELKSRNGMRVVSYEGGFVPIHDIWNAEQLYDNARLIAESREALPYWLQQYAALEREYERFQKAAMGWNDDLTAAEKAYEGLQANCVSRGEYEATLKKLDEMTKAYHTLLQDKGNTP